MFLREVPLRNKVFSFVVPSAWREHCDPVPSLCKKIVYILKYYFHALLFVVIINEVFLRALLQFRLLKTLKKTLTLLFNLT